MQLFPEVLNNTFDKFSLSTQNLEIKEYTKNILEGC